MLLISRDKSKADAALSVIKRATIAQNSLDELDAPVGRLRKVYLSMPEGKDWCLPKVRDEKEIASTMQCRLRSDNTSQRQRWQSIIRGGEEQFALLLR